MKVNKSHPFIPKTFDLPKGNNKISVRSRTVNDNVETTFKEVSVGERYFKTII